MKKKGSFSSILTGLLLISVFFLITSVEGTSGTETIGSGEKMCTPQVLNEGDTVTIEITVTSGSCDISVMDSDNHDSFIYGDGSAYHLEWVRSISSSKTIKYTAKKSDTFYVCFFNGGATFSYDISANDIKGAAQMELILNIASIAIIFVIILFINSKDYKPQ